MNRVLFALRCFYGCFFVFVSINVNAAPLWSDTKSVPTAARSAVLSSGTRPFLSRKVSADLTDIRKTLTASAKSRSKKAITGIDIPMPDGSIEKFSVETSSVMANGLAAKFPEIKTYKVRGIDNPSSSGRVDVTPKGFHAFIFTDKGLVYVDPVVSDEQDGIHRYQSYYKKDFVASNQHLARNYSCGMSQQHDHVSESLITESLVTRNRFVQKTEGEIYTYRLAVATTGEYSAAVGGGDVVTNTMAEIVTAIGRVNEIYERDLAIRLILVDNNEALIKTDAANDGYTNDSIDSLLEQNQIITDNIIGNANYDVGHVFSTDGGGLAGLGVVCDGTYKAQGATGLASASELKSDVFYIEFVAHEIGHQFGADHSFNGSSGFCVAPNRNAPTAYEPGGGSTIMSYVGICDEENVKTFVGSSLQIKQSSDDNFHATSIDEIVEYTRNGIGNSCNASLSTVNSSPTVDAGADYVIPVGTPFTLTGTATDVEGDVLSYQWLQMDLGTQTDATTFGTDLGDNPLFMTLPPVENGSRTIPELGTILASLTNPAETLPTTTRALNFRLLVRDGQGGVDSDNIEVRSNAVAGPFRILQPNTSAELDARQQQYVNWAPACTAIAPVNCSNVDILLSTDGGINFTELISSTPNDGEQQVTLSGTTTNARIKIQCSDNIFFDVSDVDFTISDNSGVKLSSMGTVDSASCSNVPVFISALTVNITENTTDTGYVASATDVDGDVVTYNLSGGADISKFTVNSLTGALSFVISPDYESPGDANRDNVYQVEITAVDDSAGLLSSSQNISVTVTDVNENSAASGGGVINLWSMLGLLLMTLLRKTRLGS